MGFYLRVFVRLKSRACYKSHVRTSYGALKVNNRKIPIFNNVRSIFNDSQFVAVLHYNDLSSQDWNDLRIKLDKHDITIKVVPTKISRKSLTDTSFVNLSPLLRGPTALAFSNKPCINDLLSVLKTESKLYLLGGVVDNELMTPKSIESYSKLPSRDVVHAQLVVNLTVQQQALGRLLFGGTAGRLSSMLNQLSHNEN